MNEETLELYNGKIKVAFNNKARNRYLVSEGQTSWSPIGVTTILGVLNKPALMLWPLNEAMGYIRGHVGALLRNDELDGDTIEKLLEQAEKAYVRKGDKGKDIGSQVHELIEKFLKYEMQAPQETGDYQQLIGKQDKEVIKSFKAFLMWFDEVQPKVLAVERIVYSKFYDYAGKFDCLLEIDGKTVLCDIKTSNHSRTAPLGIYPEYFLQLGGYANAYIEETDRVIDDLMVINASKQGKVSVLRASELDWGVERCIARFVGTVEMYRAMNDLSYKVKNVVQEEKV